MGTTSKLSSTGSYTKAATAAALVVLLIFSIVEAAYIVVGPPK